ncbi:MAG: beta strand repeat-containing protein, partial [Cyanobium sp.]
AAALAGLTGEPLPGSSALLSDPAALAAAGLTTNGDITLAGGLLSVDRSLLLDALGGNVLLQGARINPSSQAGADIRGAAVAITSSAVTLASLATESLSVSGSARLDLSGTLSLPALHWSGGTISGNGTLVTPSGGTATLTGNADKILQNKTWENSGTINLTAGRLSLSGNDPSNTSPPYTATLNGPRLVNQSGGVIQVSTRNQSSPIVGFSNPSTGSGSVIGGAQLINASGASIDWQAASNSSSSYTRIANNGLFSFDNHGVVNVYENLRLFNLSNSTASVDSGSYAISTAKALSLAGTSSNRTLGVGSNITGSGSLRIDGADLTIANGPGAGPTAGSPGAFSLAATGDLSINSGRLSLASGGPLMIASLALRGGTLNAGDAITLPALQWSGGTITGGGTLVTPSGGTAALSGSGAKFLLNKTWQNSGTINLNDGYLAIFGHDPGNNATVPGPQLINQSGGTININTRNASSPIYGASFGLIGGARFTNASGGTINWNASSPDGSEYTQIDNRNGFGFDNHGSFNINQDLQFLDTSNSAANIDSGSYIIANAKTLSFAGNSLRTLGPGSRISGKGFLRIDGANLAISGGSLSASEDLNLNGALSISSGGSAALEGALHAASGSLSINGGSISLAGPATLGSLSLADGLLSGTGSLRVEQEFSRSGGQIAPTLSGISIIQASGDLAPGALSVAGELALATLDPGGTLQIRAPLQSTTAGAIRLIAAGDVVLSPGARLATDASSDAIVIAAGGSFTNLAGSSALAAPGGRWLVFSTTPSSGSRGGLRFDFKQYAKAYDDPTAISASGNGFLYSIAPQITATLNGTISKPYDGSITATLSGANYFSTGAIDGDLLSLNNPLTGVYNSKDAATANTASVVGLAIASALDPGLGAPVYGYSLANASASAAASITPKVLGITGTTASNKTYDGTTNASITPGTLSGLISGERLNLSATGSFDSKNAGLRSVNATYQLSDDPYSGGLAANYFLTPSTVLAASINKAALTITANSGSALYNGAMQSISGFTASGLLPEESSAELATVQAGGNGRDVGTYATTARGTAINYNLDFVDGTFTILRAPLTTMASTYPRIVDATFTTTQLPLINTSLVFNDDQFGPLGLKMIRAVAAADTSSMLIVDPIFSLENRNFAATNPAALSTASTPNPSTGPIPAASKPSTGSASPALRAASNRGPNTGTNSLTLPGLLTSINALAYQGLNQADAASLALLAESFRVESTLMTAAEIEIEIAVSKREQQSRDLSQRIGLAEESSQLESISIEQVQILLREREAAARAAKS